ncbi:MAG: DUF4886 domain-containing protein [Clostridia bacterium]|nr:DUF4886 domain-containing protein [Clostridia bacterium]
MKILSIGNSFSTDAQRWLHGISLAEGGEEIECVNLYIGGCSLLRHHKNLVENRCDYDYERNGIHTIVKVSLEEVLSSGVYHAVTFQQTSRTSGITRSYFPYITDLDRYVREKQPHARRLFHQTWAYEIDSTHRAFEYYAHNTDEMTRRIIDSTETVAFLLDQELIRCGEFIDYLRKNISVFDYRNGGLSLNRDGYHLTKNYGRFAVGAMWYASLTGNCPVNAEGFIDFALKNGDENVSFELEKVEIILSALREFLSLEEREMPR